MNEAEQRTLGSALSKTLAGSGTFTPPGTHEVYCIVPIVSATIKAVNINVADGYDTHLSADGLTGGAAVTLTTPMVGCWSSVTCSGGTAICLVRLRA